MIGTGCILGRASRTKETLPDFREWCRVTRHPLVFRGLTGCQRTPRIRASQLFPLRYHSLILWKCKCHCLAYSFVIVAMALLSLLEGYCGYCIR